VAPDDTDRRETHRASVMLTALVDCAAASRAMTLRNLSPRGACVEGGVLPEQGASVMFKRNGIRARSRVAWVSGTRCGLEFVDDLNLQAALRAVPQLRTGGMHLIRRPGLKSRPLTENERTTMETRAVRGIHVEAG
jgi:hypothetical protein